MNDFLERIEDARLSRVAEIEELGLWEEGRQRTGYQIDETHDTDRHPNFSTHAHAVSQVRELAVVTSQLLLDRGIDRNKRVPVASAVRNEWQKANRWLDAAENRKISTHTINLSLRRSGELESYKRSKPTPGLATDEEIIPVARINLDIPPEGQTLRIMYEDQLVKVAAFLLVDGGVPEPFEFVVD